MPLVSCPVCEASVSKKAHACPKCGEPDPVSYHARNRWLGNIFWLLVIAGIGYFAWVALWPMLVDTFNR
ncbi:hypothetical protein [Veronia pacifica]|uniref:Uncharacterized protein n=1 Tax=Veronia pacifica TaxID=1080227 RepID=A0A1C3EKG4_9GAMM|nr:hypothetical protein [Veronia pacifica]ODA33733.1 hypothetical protein A8L45_08840 [Veronia pacifica]